MREWDKSFGGEVVVVGWLSIGDCFKVFLLRVVGWWIWREESVCEEGKGPERGESS